MNNTYRDIQNTVRTAICGVLGLGTDSVMVRYSYQESGAPSWQINDDVVFLDFREMDDTYNHQRNSTHEARVDGVYKITSRTRVWQVTIVAYGPNSYDLLNKIKDGFYRWEVKSELSKKELYLVPELSVITRTPELYNEMWWTRHDYKVKLNELYVVEENLGQIESVPLEIFK